MRRTTAVVVSSVGRPHRTQKSVTALLASFFPQMAIRAVIVSLILSYTLYIDSISNIDTKRRSLKLQGFSKEQAYSSVIIRLCVSKTTPLL